MSLSFLMRAFEPACRVICTAAYYDDYRRKYFPEIFNGSIQMTWEQLVQTIGDIDPRLAVGLAAGATLIIAGTTYVLRNNKGNAVVEQLPAPVKPLTDELEEALRQQQIEEAARVEAARVEAARVEAARVEAARVEAAIEKAAIEKAAIEKAAIEKAAIEKAATEKAALEKAAIEKAASEKAAIEKAAREKAASEKAVREEAARIDALKKQEQEAKKRAQIESAQRSVNVVALSQPQGAVAAPSQAELLAEQSYRLVEAQKALVKQAPRALPVVAATSSVEKDEPTTVSARMTRAREVAQSEVSLKLQQMPVKPAAAAAPAPKKEERTVGQKLATQPLIAAYLASTKATPGLRQAYKVPHQKNGVVATVLNDLHVQNGFVPTGALEIEAFNQGIDDLEAALDAKLEQTEGEMERAALVAHKSTVHSYRM